MTTSSGESDPAERRREPRYLTHRRVCPGITELGIGFDAQILDVSRSGLRMLATKPLNPPSMVSLQVDALEVEGQVCYCRGNEDGTYEVGLLIRGTGSA